MMSHKEHEEHKGDNDHEGNCRTESDNLPLPNLPVMISESERLEKRERQRAKLSVSIRG